MDMDAAIIGTYASNEEDKKKLSPPNTLPSLPSLHQHRTSYPVSTNTLPPYPVLHQTTLTSFPDLHQHLTIPYTNLHQHLPLPSLPTSLPTNHLTSLPSLHQHLTSLPSPPPTPPLPPYPVSTKHLTSLTPSPQTPYLLTQSPPTPYLLTQSPPTPYLLTQSPPTPYSLPNLHQHLTSLPSLHQHLTSLPIFHVPNSHLAPPSFVPRGSGCLKRPHLPHQFPRPDTYPTVLHMSAHPHHMTPLLQAVRACCQGHQILPSKNRTNICSRKHPGKHWLWLIGSVRLVAAICHAHGLSDRQQPLSMPSEETAVYVGRIMCDGEGQLNAKSCLLDGPTKRNRGCTVKMDLPDSITCSLFPGQVVAVEGVNMYSGVLIPSNIYEKSNFSEFTMVMAAGPFTTSDNLEMEPLQQLMRIVVTERPDVLILCGPFVDLTHDLVKDGNLDVTFEDIFRDKVLSVLTECAKQTKTSIVMLPSLKDAHHQYPVYPQPPFQFTKPGFHMASDPSTLAINGLCVGITSTDVLFHLSARTMFRGAPGDRMATLVGHVLKQQSYYPLQPTFVRENQLNNTESDADHTGVNMDLSQQQGLELPVKPDILFLPSDLKPFAKVVSGCVCINPGRLTKMAVGGTYCKIAARHRPGVQQDLSTCIGVQIVHI
eukprot:Em0018g1024a